MLEVKNMIRKKIEEEALDSGAISVRNIINWAVDVKNSGDILSSSWSTIIWAVSLDDERFQNEIFEDIVKKKLYGMKP